MKVGIFGQSNNEITIKYANILMEILRQKNIAFVVEENFGRSYVEYERNKDLMFFTDYHDLDPGLDFFFTIGGDGTFLRAVTLIRDHKIPILGINTGRLGFLATVPKDEIADAMELLVEGAYKIRKRILLSVRIEGDEQPFEGLNFAPPFGSCSLQQSHRRSPHTDDPSPLHLSFI